MTARIERDSPFEQLDALTEHESWRKEVNRPIYAGEGAWKKGRLFKRPLAVVVFISKAY